MKVNKQQLVIPTDNPFLNDKLNRQPFAEQLTNVVRNNQDGIVMSLTGQWGEGKTTFIKMWQAHLASENIPCIYFDAFEHDHMDSPFVSIASEINQFVKNNKEIEDELKESFATQSKKVSKKVLKYVGGLALKVVTLNVINSSDIDVLESIKDEIADGARSQFSDFIEDQFDNHKENKELFQSYKDKLSQIAKHAQKKDVPLVIIVDELDRCKPTYAIEVLEKIKHFFSVPNIVFVLSMNQTQLEESIRAVYGRNIDAHTYLQKFIDLSATMPRAEFSESGNNNFLIWKLAQIVDNNVFDGLNSLNNEENHASYVNLLLEGLVNFYNLSYRQTERVINNIKILIDTFDSDNKFYKETFELIILVAVLKVAEPELIKKIRQNQISYEDFVKGLPLDTWDMQPLGAVLNDRSPLTPYLDCNIDFCFNNQDVVREVINGRSFYQSPEGRVLQNLSPEKLLIENSNIFQDFIARLESFS